MLGNPGAGPTRKRGRRWAGGAPLALLLFWPWAIDRLAERPSEEPPAARPAAALAAFKDPETGRFMAPPSGALRRRPGSAAGEDLDRSTAGLAEVPGETPAGGVRLPLGGRFRTRLVARRGEDGRLTLSCETGPEAGTAAPAAAEPPVEPEG